MKLTISLLALSLFAQDASAPHSTAEDRAAIFQAQRDTLSVIMQAQQAVQQAQKREADAIARIEARLGCRIDPKMADCVGKK